jgi:hypothetical protein
VLVVDAALMFAELYHWPDKDAVPVVETIVMFAIRSICPATANFAEAVLDAMVILTVLGNVRVSSAVPVIVMAAAIAINPRP